MDILRARNSSLEKLIEPQNLDVQAQELENKNGIKIDPKQLKSKLPDQDCADKDMKKKFNYGN